MMDRLAMADRLVRISEDLTARSGDDLYELLDQLGEIDEHLGEAINAARKAMATANAAGGEIQRVVGGQLRHYTIATLSNFRGDRQPGATGSLNEFVSEMIDDMGVD